MEVSEISPFDVASSSQKKKKKQPIPKAIREQVWIKYNGRCFEHKCYISWCKNRITVFDFHVGHNKPESKGGTLDVFNLRPICSRCNTSMGDRYTITEWYDLHNKRGIIRKIFSWLAG